MIRNREALENVIFSNSPTFRRHVTINSRMLPYILHLENQVTLGTDLNPVPLDPAGLYYTAFLSIAPGELYQIYSEIYSIYNNASAPYGAYQAYKQYIGLIGCVVLGVGGN